jgi:hypothetical protein
MKTLFDLPQQGLRAAPRLGGMLPHSVNHARHTRLAALRLRVAPRRNAVRYAQGLTPSPGSPSPGGSSVACATED